MKKLWSEFKDFINRGNVMDLAVAVVMGAAFTAIINSAVGDFVTPLISLITFGVDFSSLSFTIGEGDAAVPFEYGNFIKALLNFLVTAVIIFLLIKSINALTKKNILEKDKDTKPCPYCKSTIKISAVRCPHCTTILDAEKIPEDVR